MAMAAMTLPSPHRGGSSTRPSPNPPVVATSNDGVLPLDLLYDILLRLPTEALCRFRPVCRSWRSMLCHPEFIAAAHNPGLRLLAVGIDDFSLSNDAFVVDMESGDGVRVKTAANDLSSYVEAEGRAVGPDHMVFVWSQQSQLCMLDLARGAVCILPDHAPPVGATTSCTVWHAASRGERKVLAIASLARGGEQVCKILNFGDIDSGWRDAGGPPLSVMTHVNCVTVINGVAYFLSKYAEYEETHAHHIMAFNLISEAWLPLAATLRGPANCRDVTLAELKGSLVASYTRLTSSDTHIEMWFLVDSNRSLWSKRYTIDVSSFLVEHHPPTRFEYFEKPIVMLGDGRIVMWMSVISPVTSTQDALLRVYDPKTCAAFFKM
ncbi:hypothetical protein QYE76_026823 [Lolium multiflorum]|uniref:F-box domain-containing protein n=1 Tax=Lolium multiflorum TaxID=4521 RepID=A0AAD8VXA5_LOLMU|nr:hypothetical protein QYE76_026823 [Lolium multiflorum]